MRAARWLAMSLTVALAVAEGDFLQTRTKRQSIVFPGFPSSTSPRPSSNGPDAALELPENLDLNSMDLNSLSRINSIDNITDFADLFGIPLPTEDLDVLSTRFGGETESATMATCKPELRTVELDLPVEANTLFYPTCVRLEQCGGCCYGPLLTCRPKATQVVRLKVLKTVVDSRSSRSAAGRRRRRRQRRRRQTVPSYHETEILKHLQCECGCKVREEDCNPAIHTYMESECACICKNKDDKARCEQQNDTKYWDNDSCTCYCRRPVNCSSGEVFSQTSCKCVKVASRGGFSEFL